jgi:scyllo-inositol 2-dehydrogenase (NADP+)
MRVIVVGLGVQGLKRQAIAGENVVSTVDPANDIADYKKIQDVALADFDAALVCTPDEAKFKVLEYLIENKKNVLVEKPLLALNQGKLIQLLNLAQKNGVTCYTAYNHRFEPHFIRMQELLESKALGKIYSVRMFYGNGTARLVRESAWRDQGSGVLSDLGSHLLDTLRFWFGDDKDFSLKVEGAHCHENSAFDHVILSSVDSPAIQLEMSMLSWRNHFTADVYAEKGSAHISSLCKWGPSTFTHRTRILPSGRPPEESICLVQSDPTWETEYRYFEALCTKKIAGNLEQDIWLNQTLMELAKQAGVPTVTRNAV